VGEHRAGVVIEFERSLLVPVDPAEAFVLADMSRLWEWNPAVRSSELVSGMPLTTGARYRCKIVNGPARVTATPTLTEVVPDRLIAYEGRFGFAHSRDSIAFEPEGEGTRLTFTNVSTLPRWTAPLAGMITKVFHRQAGRAIDGAVEYLRTRSANSNRAD
jgi:hypothetical protein